REVGEERVAQRRGVVAVVERAGARKEVEVRATARVVHGGALGAGEDGGEGAAVGADLGLEAIEDVRDHEELLGSEWEGGARGPMRSSGSRSWGGGKSAAP